MAADLNKLPFLQKVALCALLCVTILGAMGFALNSYLEMERLGPYQREYTQIRSASSSEGCACAESAGSEQAESEELAEETAEEQLDGDSEKMAEKQNEKAAVE